MKQSKRSLKDELISQIPNAMTTLRLVLIIPYTMLLLANNRIGATVIYLIALLSDLDGTVARKLKATSRFGAFYDPTVDALFMITAFLLLVGKGSVAIIPVALYWASAVVRLIFTLVHYKHERELRTTYISKTIAFTGYVSVLLATADAPLAVTTVLLIIGTLANIALTIEWLRTDKLKVKRPRAKK